MSLASYADCRDHRPLRYVLYSLVNHMSQNWFGQKPHAADSMVHWCWQRRETPEQFEAEWRQLRADYDLIAETHPRHEEALERLLQAKYDEARNDAAEMAAGEDLW